MVWYNKFMKNNKGFAGIGIIIAIVAVLVVGGIVYYVGTQKSTSRLPDSNVVPPGNLIGGNKDAHGCLGSAGYSWCAIKNKCLRVWEEKCEAISNTSSESSTNEVFKNQPGSIKSITVKNNNQWILAVDLLTRNPNWTPGGELPFFLNQNPKVRNLNVTGATKTYNCNGVNPDLLINTQTFISNIQEASYKTAYFDINGTNITSIYQQCLP